MKRFIPAALVLALACAGEPKGSETDTDRQSGDSMRIMVVGGPIMEVVFALGAGDHVVGRDRTSVYPDSVKDLPDVGHGENISAEGILSLKPTHVLASPFASPLTAMDQVAATGVEVIDVPDADTPEGARAQIRVIGRALGKETDAEALIAAFDTDLDRVRSARESMTESPRVMVLYARGENHVFVFGKGETAVAIAAAAGGQNASKVEGTKPLTAEGVRVANPDVIVLPKKGYDGLGGDEGVLGLPGVAETWAGQTRQFVAVPDLPLLSWGPRTGKALLTMVEAFKAAEVQPESAL